MNKRAEGVRVAYPLFQAEGGGSTPTSALQLVVESISFEDARALNRLWHSRLPAMRSPAGAMGSFPHFGAEYGGWWYAAAIWSNPVSRRLPQREWLELRRLAIAPDAPRNTASRMLRVMALLVRRMRPGVMRLVSYQDTAFHTGAIYRAAGWSRVELPGSHVRWTVGRHRNAVQSDAVKVRWEKSLAGPDAPGAGG